MSHERSAPAAAAGRTAQTSVGVPGWPSVGCGTLQQLPCRRAEGESSRGSVGTCRMQPDVQTAAADMQIRAVRLRTVFQTCETFWTVEARWMCAWTLSGVQT